MRFMILAGLLMAGCATRQTYISVPVGPHECVLTTVGIPGASQGLWACADEKGGETFMAVLPGLELPIPLSSLPVPAMAF